MAAGRGTVTGERHAVCGHGVRSATVAGVDTKRVVQMCVCGRWPVVLDASASSHAAGSDGRCAAAAHHCVGRRGGCRGCCCAVGRWVASDARAVVDRHGSAVATCAVGDRGTVWASRRCTARWGRHGRCFDCLVVLGRLHDRWGCDDLWCG